FFFVQQTRQQLGVLDAGGTDQHGLSALVAIFDVGQYGVVLFSVGFENLIVLIIARHGTIGGHDDRFEPVNGLELIGFGIGRTRHAGQLAIHAEVILEGNGGQRLVLVLDLDALLGLNRLMQAIGPASTRHQATREFVDNDDFVVLHNVLLVT